ncbi:phosphotransferase enzyme family protein [Anaerosporobacter faecicola]|uniref:phosphotransferase enzyme family protein n=1 Tax=Anaerosporobacter faecicola TaxID=2718714 RepID=UPI001EE61165|nr:phosphotransferase [Anaerosporobacter faecicola]
MLYNEVEKSMLLAAISGRYDLAGYEFTPIQEHEGGRNKIYILHNKELKDVVLRISNLGDRTKEDYLAELEFVQFLHKNGASVANVIESNHHNLLEQFDICSNTFTVCMFERAKGMLLAENNYRYREGVSLHEYFFNCGKVLGKIHRISSDYTPIHQRYSFFDRFNEEYLNQLIPDEHALLKLKFNETIQELRYIDQNRTSYGMIHFDFGDSNYSIDFETGNITVYDFDNCCMGFYMYDLADVWTHGVGWIQFEPNARKRRDFMEEYFHYVLEGYRSENNLDETLLQKLPLFINVTILENIVDEIETMLREGQKIEWDEELIYLEKCILDDIPYRGFFNEIYFTEHPFE